MELKDDDAKVDASFNLILACVGKELIVLGNGSLPEFACCELRGKDDRCRPKRSSGIGLEFRRNIIRFPERKYFFCDAEEALYGFICALAGL